MLSFISVWLFLLTLAYSNSHLLLLFTLSFLFSPALNSSYGFLFLLPSCLLPVAQMVLRDPDVGMLHDARGIEQLPERVNPRSHCSFQISPLLANSYLWALGSLGNKPSEDGLPCNTILWKPFWNGVLCSWRGHEAAVHSGVMRKQKHEPNCLTQHLALLLD